MPLLTIFTPTYNRKHTLIRTYNSLLSQSSKDFSWLIVDDGSVDGTQDWVESLGDKIISSGKRYNWMGIEENHTDGSHFVIDNSLFRIEYVYKPNGGLYTGYNTAYSIIESELCVCVDSDDYLPDNAVELISFRWMRLNDEMKTKYGGLIGLDFNVEKNEPIGGFFPTDMEECNVLDIEAQRIHNGDTKEVLRTELMKTVSPMYGYMGEKNFNPWYLIMQVLDIYPMLVINDNLCWVEYQIGKDSMSQNIWKQYFDSPRSFARYRLMCMKMKHSTFKNRIRNCIHYISSCFIANDHNWLRNTPYPIMTLLLVPFGLSLSLIVYYKNR